MFLLQLHPDSGCAGCNCIDDFKRTGGVLSVPQEMSQVTDSQVRKDSLMYSAGYRCVSVVRPRVSEALASGYFGSV